MMGEFEKDVRKKRSTKLATAFVNELANYDAELVCFIGMQKNGRPLVMAVTHLPEEQFLAAVKGILEALPNAKQVQTIYISPDL